MRRSGIRVLALFAAAALAAARGPGQEPPPTPAAAGPESPCPTPRLRLAASSDRPRQGGVVVLTLTSDVPLARAEVSDGKRRAALEADPAGGGRVLRGLWGIDFEAAVGARSTEVEVFGRCGDEHPTSWTYRVGSGRFPQQKLTVDPAFVEPPPEELARIARDRERVAQVWTAAPTARRWDRPFRLPVDAPVRESFGARRVFNGKTQSRHGGVDLVAASGTPIRAPAPGTVMLAEDLYYSGGTVILDHGGGLFTTYFHMSRIDAKPGDRVRAGDVLGAVGATGRVTGPHLHWGARLHDARVNPVDLLKLPSWPN